MTANPPQLTNPEFPPSEGWPDYPSFGSSDDVQARMKLMDWLWDQIGVTVHPEVGDHVLATEGRVLGYGPDLDALYQRLLDAEPELKNARIVGHTVPPNDR